MSDDISLDIDHFFPYRITRLSSYIAVNFANQHAKPFGLSIPEWRVIAVLGRYYPLSSKEVASRSNMDKVKVSRAISRLTAAGLIRRKNDAADMRRSLLKLTAKGRRVHDKIIPVALELEADLLSVLSDQEAATFNRLIDRLYEHLQQRYGGDSSVE